MGKVDAVEGTTETNIRSQTFDVAERRSLLRRGFASALRAGGYSEVAAGEVHTTQPSSNLISTGFAVMLLAGASLGTADVVGAAAWSWPLIVLGVLMVVGVVSNHFGGAAGAALIFIWWIASGWLQVRGDGLWTVSHAGPAVLWVTGAILTKQIDVRSARDIAIAAAVIPRSAPLIAPLVLVVLVLPALSEDVWAVAGALTGPRFAAVAVLTVGLMFVLVLRQLRIELLEVIKSRASALTELPNRAELSRTTLRARLQDDPFSLVDGAAGHLVDGTWPTDGAQYAPFLAATASGKLGQPLTGRLALCVAFVALVVFAYTYGIIVAVVDPGVVAGWTEDAVPVQNLEVLGANASLPHGVYFAMTGLLTCLAVATFLAFTLIEEKFAIALGDALLRMPVDRFLALALPYLSLVEERIVNGDPLSPEFDVGAPGERPEASG